MYSMKQTVIPSISENYTIVVIEDSPSDALFTKIALEEISEDLRVAWLKDGEEAINFLFPKDQKTESNTYNSIKVILLDLNLPKYNGFEVLSELKKHETTQKIPVIMFSSSEIKSGIQRCLDAGAEEYIVKSIDLDDYTQSVKRAVEPRLAR